MANGQLNRFLIHLRGLVRPEPGDGLTDGQLLQRFADLREEESFAALVHRHGGLVLGVCRRVLRDEHEAEDAFQATFLVLARKAASIRKGESVSSWLYGVAQRIAVKARAKAARRALQEKEIVVLAREDPVAEAMWRELRPVLDEEVNRLPEKYRAPVVLCYLENKTNFEAARQLGWTKGTVSGRLARAREMLRTRLARRGVALSGTLLAAGLTESAKAAVPTFLGSITIHLATHPAAAGAVPASVTALVEGVLYAMAITKLKFVTALVLALGILAGGTARITHQLIAGEPESGATGARKLSKDEEIALLKAENEKLRKENQSLRRAIQLTNAKLDLAEGNIIFQRAAKEYEAVARARAARAQIDAQLRQERAIAELQKSKADLAVGQATREQAVAELGKARATVAVAEAQVKRAEAQVKQAELKVKAQPSQEGAIADLRKAQADLAVVQAERQQTIADLRKAQPALALAEAQLKQAELQVEKALEQAGRLQVELDKLHDEGKKKDKKLH